jgi:hypothetical protein
MKTACLCSRWTVFPSEQPENQINPQLVTLASNPYLRDCSRYATAGLYLGGFILVYKIWARVRQALFKVGLRGGSWIGWDGMEACCWIGIHVIQYLQTAKVSETGSRSCQAKYITRSSYAFIAFPGAVQYSTLTSNSTPRITTQNHPTPTSPTADL